MPMDFSSGVLRQQKRDKKIEITPLKINMEPQKKTLGWYEENMIRFHVGL